jgi:hypothetical protein
VTTETTTTETTTTQQTEAAAPEKEVTLDDVYREAGLDKLVTQDNTQQTRQETATTPKRSTR